MTLYDLQQEFLYYCGHLITGFDAIDNLGTMNGSCIIPLIVGIFGALLCFAYYNSSANTFDKLKRIEYDTYVDKCKENCKTYGDFDIIGYDEYKRPMYFATFGGLICLGLIAWGGYQYLACSSQKDMWIDKLKMTQVPAKFNGVPRTGYDLYTDMTYHQTLENMAKNNMQNMNNRNNMLPKSGLNISFNL
jgi:hypothetical protein